MNDSAVILAAGLSTCMGRSKPLLPGGRRHVRDSTRAIASESGVDDVVVVLGHEADAVAGRLTESGVAARFVVNEAYQTDNSSVLRGLNAVDRPA
jgi:CTP:molybdopterin cytidylyltransferase MocA